MWTVWLWFQEICQLLKNKFLCGRNIPRATSPGLKMLLLPRLYSIRDECETLTKWNQKVYKQSAQRQICPTVTLSATNPTWADVRLKLGLCSAMPATNCLSCCTDRGGTIIWNMYPYMIFISGRIIRIPCSCSSQWNANNLFFYRQNTAFQPDSIYPPDTQSPTAGNQQASQTDFPQDNSSNPHDVVNHISPIPHAQKTLATPVAPLPTPQPDYSPPTQHQNHQPNMYEARTWSALKQSNSQTQIFF